MERVEYSTLLSCFKSYKRVAIFAGAGISFNSGIPTVSNIIEKIAQLLPLSKHDKRLFLNQNFPFEAFIQTIKVVTPIEGLLKIFSLGEPNNGHCLIAELVKKRKVSVVVTTNFDPLIERSLKEKKVRFRKIFITKELEKFKMGGVRPILFKLHGSIEDMVNLGITLEKVAAKAATTSAKKVLHHLLYSSDHSAVIFLGYSCSDYFDINPELRKCSDTDMHVYYINHKKTNSPSLVPISRVEPFEKFKSGLGIIANTDKLITPLAIKALGKTSVSSVTTKRNDWVDKIEKWAAEGLLKNKKIDALITCGRLMVFIGYYKKAFKYYAAAKRVGMDTYIPEKLAKIFSYTAQVYRHLGDYKNAVKSFEQALLYWKKVKSWDNYAKALSDIGSTHRLLKNYSTSRLFQQKAIRIFKRLKNYKEIYICLIITGNTYVDEEKHAAALKVFKGALRVNFTGADKPSEAILFNSLAAVCIKLKKLRDAFDYLTRAEKINKALKVKRIASAIEYNFGCYYEAISDLNTATKRFTKANKIASDTNDATQQYIILKNRFAIYQRQKRYKSALTDVLACLNILRSIPTLEKTEKKALNIIKRLLEKSIPL